MATVHYLEWDQGNEDAHEFFKEMTTLDPEDITEVPRDWYTTVAEVPNLPVEQLWHAFQGGVPLPDNDEEDVDTEKMKEARAEFQAAQTRSMCVGDLVEKNGEIHIATGFKFTPISWE